MYFNLNRLRYSVNRNIELGKSTLISPEAKIQVLNGGSVIIGSNTEIHQYSMLFTYGGNIKIGDDCSINPFCVLYGHGGLTIGNKVRIACHTVIIPANHDYRDMSKPIMEQPESRKGISIMDDVWIGAGSKILDGVSIGKGSVVGAGSVVTKSIPEYSIVAGVPARIIKMRGEAG